MARKRDYKAEYQKRVQRNYRVYGTRNEREVRHIRSEQENLPAEVPRQTPSGKATKFTGSDGSGFVGTHYSQYLDYNGLEDTPENRFNYDNLTQKAQEWYDYNGHDGPFAQYLIDIGKRDPNARYDVGDTPKLK